MTRDFLGSLTPAKVYMLDEFVASCCGSRIDNAFMEQKSMPESQTPPVRGIRSAEEEARHVEMIALYRLLYGQPGRGEDAEK